MSRPRYPWWGYVREIVRRYPVMRLEADELQKVRTTAEYGHHPGGGSGVNRTTETAALRQLTEPEQAELDAVEQAIRTSTPETVEIIRLVFWTRSHTLQGAAMRVHISYRSARRRQADFLRRVAKFRGLL